MSIKSGYTVVLAADADAVERIKLQFPRNQALEAPGWVSLRADSSPRPVIDPGDAGAACEASDGFREAYHVSCDESVNNFNYFHYIDGRLIREMHRDSDAGWWNVRGDPEPWEAELIFDPAGVAEELRRAASSGDAAFETEVRAAYERKAVAEGSWAPPVDAALLMGALARRMGWRFWAMPAPPAMSLETLRRIQELASGSGAP